MKNKICYHPRWTKIKVLYTAPPCSEADGYDVVLKICDNCGKTKEFYENFKHK